MCGGLIDDAAALHYDPSVSTLRTMADGPEIISYDTTYVPQLTRAISTLRLVSYLMLQ